VLGAGFADSQNRGPAPSPSFRAFLLFRRPVLRPRLHRRVDRTLEPLPSIGRNSGSSPSFSLRVRFAMNTPRSKPPKRYSEPKPTKRLRPDGGYSAGIYNAAFAVAIGQMTGVWPSVEEQMVGIFMILTGIKDLQSARQVFRSIINEQIRIKIMRNMLERSPAHTDKGQIYDEIIDEFHALGGIRNKYVHGLWWGAYANWRHVADRS
jgi:hypothetical protein